MLFRERPRLSLWRQVAEQLTAEIMTGVAPPGTQLPPEPELAERFGVSRNTVRRAMISLEQGGLVRIEQGRGTFVDDGVVTYELSKRTRFSTNLISQGREPSYEIKKVTELGASNTIAEHLGLDTDDPIVEIVRLGKAEQQPISLGSFYYPVRRFPGLLERARLIGSQTELLSEYGMRSYFRLRTWINSRPASETEAQMLQQPRSRWVLFTQKVDVDESGKPICFSTTCWAGDRVQFVIDGAVDGDYDSG